MHKSWLNISNSTLEKEKFELNSRVDDNILLVSLDVIILCLYKTIIHYPYNLHDKLLKYKMSLMPANTFQVAPFNYICR